MQEQGNTPKERRVKKDYFFMLAYVLAAIVIISQFFVMFSIDIMDMLGLN